MTQAPSINEALELKPCPFCGGEAKRHDIEEREDVDNAGASYIECADCGACTRLYFGYKEGLLESWNLRVRTAEFEDAARQTLEAIDSEVVLTGQLKDMVDALLHRPRYDPTTQPFDEPFRHVERHSAAQMQRDIDQLHGMLEIERKISSERLDALKSWEITAQRIQEAEANKSFDGGSCLRCGAPAALATLQPSGERREAIAKITFEHEWERPWSDAQPSEREHHLSGADKLIASGFVQDEAGWRDISTAPKDGTKIIYLNKFGEIGFCYWSEAGSSFDESLWWDDHADDECVPMHWLPRTYLPPIRSARDGGGS